MKRLAEVVSAVALNAIIWALMVGTVIGVFMIIVAFLYQRIGSTAGGFSLFAIWAVWTGYVMNWPVRFRK